jgi:hypothetical protein
MVFGMKQGMLTHARMGAQNAGSQRKNIRDIDIHTRFAFQRAECVLRAHWTVTNIFRLRSAWPDVGIARL